MPRDDAGGGADAAPNKLEEEIHKRKAKHPFHAVMNSLKQFVFRLYFRMLLYFYYRDVDIVGIDNVPTEGPVIFCGNHQNQFVDGLMLFAYCPRTPHFIIAAKSMKRRVVGDFARFMNCIPVRRPQDEAVAGDGYIKSVAKSGAGDNGEKGLATGMHTKFTQLTPGCLIAVASPKCAFKFIEAIDDHKAIIVYEGENVIMDEPSAYKVQPRINQKDMWQSVFDKLQESKCIGIFPEGGSHDQTTMLDMKDGVARFAFGSLEHGNTKAPVIVPVGLTYYYGHRFRSRAHMEFGKPIRVDEAWFAKYQGDKQGTIKEFMGKLKGAMEDVTIQCSGWARLKQVHFMRRLYLPPTMTLEADEYLRATRRIAQGMDVIAEEEDPEVTAFLERLDNYQVLLKNYLLTDHQVVTLTQLQRRTSYKLMFHRVFTTSFWFVLSLPGVIMNLPVGIAARIYSDVKSKEAVAASSVKIKGNDVKASFKIICCMAMGPIWIALIALFSWIYLGFGMAVLTWVVYPTWTYWSVVWANHCLVSARSTFPILLSLHSTKYESRFRELYALREALVAEVRYIVHTKLRGREKTWSMQAEALYHRVLVFEDTAPVSVNDVKPFTLSHNSRAAATPRRS